MTAFATAVMVFDMDITELLEKRLADCSTADIAQFREMLTAELGKRKAQHAKEGELFAKLGVKPAKAPRSDKGKPRPKLFLGLGFEAVPVAELNALDKARADAEIDDERARDDFDDGVNR